MITFIAPHSLERCIEIIQREINPYFQYENFSFGIRFSEKVKITKIIEEQYNFIYRLSTFRNGYIDFGIRGTLKKISPLETKFEAQAFVGIKTKLLWGIWIIFLGYMLLATLFISPIDQNSVMFLIILIGAFSVFYLQQTSLYKEFIMEEFERKLKNRW